MADMICSEVHTFTHQLEGTEGVRLARFMFSTPSSLSKEWTSLRYGPAELDFSGLRRSRSIPVDVGEDSGEEDIEVPRFNSLDCRGLGDRLEYDSDGDMDLPRKGTQRDNQLVVEHMLATKLGEVGLQVWRGSLVLADYLLEHHQQFYGKKVLDIGSGTALAALVASICGSNVLATDINNKEILKLMQRNVERNRHLLEGEVVVKALNFKDDLMIVQEDLKNIEIVLAGDIIYDDDITEDFIEFMVNLHNIVKCDTLKFIVALEKRFVFTVADLDTVAPAHDFFMDQLEQFSNKYPLHKICTTKISLDFTQYFCYERSKDMLMLEIVVKKND